MSDKIFFSYSRSDSVFVLKLANDLRNAEATIWLDQLDIPPGCHWDNAIEEALNSSNCLLAILSPKSMESNNAMDEISYALEERKKVIPVLLTNTETPFRLRRLQRVDFTGDYDKGFRQLLSAINLENADIPNTNPAQPEAEQKQTSEKSFPGLKNDPQNDLEQKETGLWSEASALNTREGYQDYLKNTSSKEHADKAQHYLNQPEMAAAGDHRKEQLANIKSPLAGSKKKYLFAVMGLVVLAGVTWAAFKIMNNNSGIEYEDHTRNQIPQANIEKDDSLNEMAEPPDTAGNILTGEPEVKERDMPSAKKESKKNLSNKPAQDQKAAGTHKDEEGNYDKGKTTTVQSPAENGDPPTLPETNSTAPKEIVINARVPVNLSLLQMPDMNQRKKTEQFVKFSVTKPVYHNGVMIIRQGAIALGS